MKLKIKKMGKVYWIIGDDDSGPIGPYENREEAKEDLIGVENFYKYRLLPGYICSSEVKHYETL